MTTFEQLKKIVMPTLKAYHTDLTEHDCKALTEYKGKFLYAWRPTGTNMIKLEDNYHKYFAENFLIHNDENRLKKAYREEIIWITHEMNNQGTLYFDGLKFHRITKQQAADIHKKHIEEIIKKYENRNNVQPDKLCA
jgi:CRISPR/Cas system CSM-associated protein Csm5 (group 7 of RAMP superfamily)